MGKFQTSDDSQRYYSIPGPHHDTPLFLPNSMFSVVIFPPLVLPQCEILNRITPH